MTQSSSRGTPTSARPTWCTASSSPALTRPKTSRRQWEWSSHQRWSACRMAAASRRRSGTQVHLPLFSRPGAVSFYHRRVRHTSKRHYRKALGALVVYDITKYESFENVRKWIEGIREHASPYVVIVIVGNKLDLRKNSEQAVSAT